MSAVQHIDVRKLRLAGKINNPWSPTELRPYVNDKYVNQTVANFSACPCGEKKGFHCNGVDTQTCRFIRLENHKYCIPEESPSICPIHGASSITNKNPYVIEFGVGISQNDKSEIELTWKEFYSFTEAARYSNNKATIYMQTSKTGRILRIGRASLGLSNRYNYGYLYTLDAAMWESGNKVFLAFCEKDKIESVESYLITTIKPILNKKERNTQVPTNLTVRHNNIVVDVENIRLVDYI
jgi:hypothetical protein